MKDTTTRIRLRLDRFIGADPQGRRTILCDSDPKFVLYRIARRFGLPVVPERAGWFNEELNSEYPTGRLY